MAKIYVDPKIGALRKLHADLISTDYLYSSIRERLASQARTILRGHNAKNDAVAFHLGSWSPDFIGSDSAHIMACSLTLQQAEKTIAREHGYEDWNEVEALGKTMLDAEFERTVDAVIEGDVPQLQVRLQARAELVNQRSQYGHRATLLHYIGANGVESYRQFTPLNAPEITRCLIQAGADVNAVAEIYGGSTTLNLVLTSAHPYNAGVSQEIADLLKNAGAV